MRSAVVGLVLLALVLTNDFADAHRKGEENWKQRYRQWKDSEERSRLHGAVIGTDEAAAAKLHREDQNSVYDGPSEDELWRQKIEEKKQRLALGKKNEGPKPASEITAWHEEKMKRKQEERLQQEQAQTQAAAAPFQFKRQKRRQPQFHSPEVRDDRMTVHSDPPPHTKVAEMARYIVHNSDWAAVSYISKHTGTYGLPMADIFSVSDGLKDNSTGIPYLYITPKDMGVQDLIQDSRCSLAMTLAQEDYCKKKDLDPEDPRCAHVFLIGKIKALKIGSDEWTRAEKFFFDRHPHLRNMPKDHKFRFAKLKIHQIFVQDFFGGPAQPSLAEYFAAKPQEVKPIQHNPAPETEAELLPGASSSDSVKWIRPIE